MSQYIKPYVMKKKVRAIIAIVFGVMSFPLIAVSVSLFGFVPFMGLIVLLSYPFHWLGNNEEGMAGALVGLHMLGAPFIAPWITWHGYYLTGELEFG